jgi:hypothetical protein
MTEPCLLGIDSNRYAIRAVLTGDQSESTHAVEAKPYESHRVVEFVQHHLRQQGTLRIVASPLDEWPEGLLTQLECSGASVSWLPPNTLRGAATEAAEWQRQRRLQRARFYTWLHRQQKAIRYWSSLELVLAWEEFLATETRALVAHERDKHGLY